MDIQIVDQMTANAALNKIGEDLAKAVETSSGITHELYQALVRIRPLGVLTVSLMADAIGCDRNFIDSVWSVHGNADRNKPTRVPVPVDGRDFTETPEYLELASIADRQRSAVNSVSLIRAERDRIITMVYASKLMGPTAIAGAVGIDRNHVLRTARKAGVAPAHRPNTSNQWTAANKTQATS
jgi:hypothetical protein